MPKDFIPMSPRTPWRLFDFRYASVTDSNVGIIRRHNRCPECDINGMKQNAFAHLEMVYMQKLLIFKWFCRSINSRCDVSLHTCSSKTSLHAPVGHIRYRRCA